MKTMLGGIVLAALMSTAAYAQAGSSKGDQEIKHPWHGDFKDDYKDPKTKELIMHYRMYAPEKQPEQKHLGLIVCFHGANGNEDAVAPWVFQAAGRVKITNDYVIMGGKAKTGTWTPQDDKNVVAWIDWVKQTYPIDPRRVHIIGMSNGGWMVKHFGWEHQDLCATVTSYCGGGVDFSGNPKGMTLVKPPMPGNPGEAKTEWYFVHGDADQSVNVDASRKACKELGQKGYRYVYREIAGADHGGIMGFPDVIDDALMWMVALRHKEIQLAKDEKTELTSLAGKLKNEKIDTATPMLAELQRIGGPPSEKAIKNAMESSDPDVKKAAIATAEKTLYGKDVVIELIKLLKDKSDDVQAASLKALAVASNWRYLEAQEILIQTARKKTNPVDDRVLAVQGLAKTVKLDLLGNFEDKQVVWTLVLLLDDDDQKIREAAFAGLEKAVKNGFEYKPDLTGTERKAAVARWKAWAETKAGAIDKPGQPGRG